VRTSESQGHYPETGEAGVAAGFVHSSGQTAHGNQQLYDSSMGLDLKFLSEVPQEWEELQIRHTSSSRLPGPVVLRGVTSPELSGQCPAVSHSAAVFELSRPRMYSGTEQQAAAGQRGCGEAASRRDDAIDDGGIPGAIANNGLRPESMT
jgi:hypothetical protein